MIRYWNLALILGVSLMISSLLSCAGELMFAGRSAQDAFNNDGVIKLLKAVSRHDGVEAKRLVDSGVNINTLGKDGATPLIWMLGQQNLQAVKLLLELGADPNQYELDGVGPPVWLSAGGGRKEALQLLLDHGGNPNLVYGNESPLMIAISGSHLDCAELLLQRGADINYANGGVSAMDMAMLHVQFGDALWLLNHGYTYNLPLARRTLAIENPRKGQENSKTESLEIIDRLLSQQKH